MAVRGGQHHPALRILPAGRLLPVAQVDGVTVAESNQRGGVGHAALHLLDDLPEETELLPETLSLRRGSGRELGGGHRAKGNVS